jgi:hypothetical protein
LSSPSTYGGASYPTDNATAAVPTFTYVYRTQEVFSRCFPTSTSWAGASAELCVTPKCTDAALDPLKAALSGSFACAVLEARPDETTTWEVCPSGAPPRTPPTPLPVRALCCRPRQRPCLTRPRPSSEALDLSEARVN